MASRMSGVRELHFPSPRTSSPGMLWEPNMDSRNKWKEWGNMWKVTLAAVTPLRLQYRCSARRCHPTPPRCPFRPSLLRSCAEADLQLRLPKPSAHKGKQREPGGTRHENGKKRHPALLTWRKKLPFQTSHVPLRAWKLSGNLKLHFPACPGKQFGLPEAWSPKSTTPASDGGGGRKKSLGVELCSKRSRGLMRWHKKGIQGKGNPLSPGLQSRESIAGRRNVKQPAITVPELCVQHTVIRKVPLIHRRARKTAHPSCLSPAVCHSFSTNASALSAALVLPSKRTLPQHAKFVGTFRPLIKLCPAKTG
ncbi:uncharacterized protein [Anas platyrhynchos]|uniref:uncharacterized protein n=1 Tax=Anas platyrhynchos TaxID=8839 RepID=UPI003AF1E3BC